MPHLPHYEIVQEIVAETSGETGLLGILLTGSLARGDALPGSDIDLKFLLTTKENCTSFQAETRRGIFVEKGCIDMTHALSQLVSNPMGVYSYLDGRILFDPTGALSRLVDEARNCFKNYRTPEEERKKINYWLKSVRQKTYAAQEVGNVLKAAYVSSTSSWPILTGLWAVNDKPLPPSGAVWPHLKDLTRRPDDLEELLQQLFLGDTPCRIQTTIDLADWITTQLDRDSEAAAATESIP